MDPMGTHVDWVKVVGWKTVGLGTGWSPSQRADQLQAERKRCEWTEYCLYRDWGHQAKVGKSRQWYLVSS